MKLIIIALSAVLLSGCAITANPEVEKSLSKDRTMSNMTKIALINEMLNSPDPAVRLEGSRIAKEFIVPKKNWLGQ